MQIKKVIALGTACIFAGAACFLAVRAFASPSGTLQAKKSRVEITEPVPSLTPLAAPAAAPTDDWKSEREALVRQMTELKLKASNEAEILSKQIAAAEAEREELHSKVRGLQESLKAQLAAEPVQQAKAKSRLTPEIVTP